MDRRTRRAIAALRAQQNRIALVAEVTGKLTEDAQ